MVDRKTLTKQQLKDFREQWELEKRYKPWDNVCTALFVLGNFLVWPLIWLEAYYSLLLYMGLIFVTAALVGTVLHGFIVTQGGNRYLLILFTFFLGGVFLVFHNKDRFLSRLALLFGALVFVIIQTIVGYWIPFTCPSCGVRLKGNEIPSSCPRCAVRLQYDEEEVPEKRSYY